MGRIVELSTKGLSLHKERGFLTIKEASSVKGRIPLDDIDAVIAAAHGITWSGNSLAALAERSIPVVFIGQNFAPVAHILPITGHHAQGVIMQAQAEASLPLKKRLWADIVRQKIIAQNAALALFGNESAQLKEYARQVRSGDPDNREAAAAQIYWRTLMSSNFKRERNAAGLNSALNYGYAILRAATARAVVASGLNPALSIHHASAGDGLRLADDLMEPFRPAIDIIIRDCKEAFRGELTPDLKLKLVGTLQVDYQTINGRSPLSRVLVRCAQSLARVYQKTGPKMEWPTSLLPCAATLFDEQEEVWDSVFP